MLQKLKPTAWMALLLIGCTGIAGIAWQNKAAGAHPGYTLQDTLPRKEKAKEDKTIIKGDIDQTIEEVNRAKENLENKLQNKDWEKMHRELELSLEKINTENIEEQVAKAVKEIDFQKVQLQIQAALQKIDWEKIQKEIQKAQAELKNNLDSRKIETDIQRSMEETKKTMAELKAVDMVKIQRELEKTREELVANEAPMKENLERAKEEIDRNLKKDFKKELETAREGIDRAIEELHNYKDMLNEMEKDGLVNPKEPYNIEYKKGELFINGVKQPETITGKYKHYFKKDNVQLKKEKDDENDKKTIHL